MMDLEAAKKSVISYLNEKGFDGIVEPYEIFYDETIETEDGWVFFPVPKSVSENDGLFATGVSPLFVEKKTGRIVAFGSALSVEEYLQIYREKLANNEFIPDFIG